MRFYLKNIIFLSIMSYLTDVPASDFNASWNFLVEDKITVVYLADLKNGKVSMCLVNLNNEFSKCKNILEDSNFKDTIDFIYFHKDLCFSDKEERKIFIYEIDQENGFLKLKKEIDKLEFINEINNPDLSLNQIYFGTVYNPGHHYNDHSVINHYFRSL